MRRDAIQMEAAPLSNGTVRFRVTGEDGTVYDMTGRITDFELRIERDSYPCVEDFGYINHVPGLRSETVTFTVQCTEPTRREGPRYSADLIAGINAASESRSYAPGGYIPAVQPRVDREGNPIHQFIAVDGEPGICGDCEMWPEHHNHGRSAGCVCTGCMPDADALPDLDEPVPNSSAATMGPPHIRGASHP